MPEGLAVGLRAVRRTVVGRTPYNPATSGPQVHDRRAREINRGSVGHLSEAEVDDPFDPSAKIITMRSTRDDPLGDRFARGHIDQAQYLAGREFQRWFGIAERGPRAMQLAESVDGRPALESLTDEQLKAGNWLVKCYRLLGSDGTTLAHEMLILNLTARQMAAARGLRGQGWEVFFARRLSECLNTLAVAFGFATAR
jgi:hypothetical protein